MNILEKITERTKERIEEEKKIVPLEEVRRQAEEKGIKDQIPVFEQALRADRLSFICEAKKASPSKGLIFHMLRSPENMKQAARQQSPV